MEILQVLAKLRVDLDVRSNFYYSLFNQINQVYQKLFAAHLQH